MSNLMTQAVLAAATGSTDGLGKIAAEPAAGILYVRFDCAPNTYAVEWCVQANKAHAVQTYRAMSNVLGGTITLADATVVDDEDTCVLNGLTLTAEATEGDVAAADREFWTGANNAAAAVNLAALINNATYGIPGVTASTPVADGATDVITIAATTAPVLQFGQGASDAAEIAWASTTLASLIKDGAAVTGVAANHTTAGTLYRQVVYGWPYAYLAVTNSDGADAATIVVKATGYAA